jgi:myo-inositol-1(or 4)-monophosphatase
LRKSEVNPDHNRIIEIAWQAADAAGQVIRESWRQPKIIEYKGVIDLVTPVDRESERIIVNTIQGQFPNHSILAEEDTSVRGSDHECRWIIDPLDGTTNFAHGYPQFCISIAFEYRGTVVVGLVYDPVRQECFKAALGGGASLNGTPIHASSIAQLDKALLGTGFPYDRRELSHYYLSYFKTFMIRSQGIRRGGSAALDLCYVACGRFDGFWELKLRPWDTAAGALMVTEAGGTISDFSGNRFSIYGQQTLASNSLVHREMMEIASAIAHENPR